MNKFSSCFDTHKAQNIKRTNNIEEKSELWWVLFLEIFRKLFHQREEKKKRKNETKAPASEREKNWKNEKFLRDSAAQKENLFFMN